MKIRPAGSSQTLEESMEQVVEIPDRAAVLVFLREHYGLWEPTPANVTVKPFGYDPRTGWDTYLVSVDGNAALFSDGPLG